MNSEPATLQSKKRRLPIVGLVIAGTLVGASCGPFFDRITITHGPAIELKIARSLLYGSLVGLSLGVVFVIVIRRLRLPLGFFFELMMGAVLVSLLALNVQRAEDRLEESNERFRARFEEMRRSAEQVFPNGTSP